MEAYPLQLEKTSVEGRSQNVLRQRRLQWKLTLAYALVTVCMLLLLLAGWLFVVAPQERMQAAQSPSATSTLLQSTEFALPFIQQPANMLLPMLAIFACAALVGLVAGWLIASWTTHRLNQLVAAANAWHAGDFNIKAPAPSHDEIGQLAQRMNQMAAELQASLTVRQEIASLQEQQRLARELHDTVVQTLFSTSMVAGVLPRLYAQNPTEGARRAEEVAHLSREALAEMRSLLMELHPAALHQASFAELLQHLATTSSGRTRTPVDVRIEGDPMLSPAEKHALYRITQEALQNIIKHARATQVRIHFIAGQTGLLLHIQDNGCGFDTRSIPANGAGLQTMQQRAQAIGATLQIESTPGSGTFLRVLVRWTNALPPPSSSFLTPL